MEIRTFAVECYLCFSESVLSLSSRFVHPATSALLTQGITGPNLWRVDLSSCPHVCGQRLLLCVQGRWNSSQKLEAQSLSLSFERHLGGHLVTPPVRQLGGLCGFLYSFPFQLWAKCCVCLHYIHTNIPVYNLKPVKTGSAGR